MKRNNKPASTLYVCYQSLMDPLTRTQVVAYLEGLALVGYQIYLMTFEKDLSDKALLEKLRKELASKNIEWHYLKYHKRPTVPATLFDVMMGVRLGRKLIKKHQIQLVHARAHIPGMVALGLKKLTGCKILFDVRGLIAEEYVAAGSWKEGGYIFRSVKKMERQIVKASDGLIVLTQKAMGLFKRWYPEEIEGKPFIIIPCCTDLRKFSSSRGNRRTHQSKHGFVYVGKLGGRYYDKPMVEFMVKVLKGIPDAHWNVWTQSDTSELMHLVRKNGIENRVNIGFVPVDQLMKELKESIVGLSFTKPCFSIKATSPTKIGEYLASGIAVVSTPGIGDVDELLMGKKDNGELPVGVIYSPEDDSSFENCIRDLKKLLEDENTPERCKAVARKELDLETVGWVRYRKMYQDLIGPAG